MPRDFYIQVDFLLGHLTFKPSRRGAHTKRQRLISWDKLCGKDRPDPIAVSPQPPAERPQRSGLCSSVESACKVSCPQPGRENTDVFDQRTMSRRTTAFTSIVIRSPVLSCRDAPCSAKRHAELRAQAVSTVCTQIRLRPAPKGAGLSSHRGLGSWDFRAAASQELQ